MRARGASASLRPDAPARVRGRAALSAPVQLPAGDEVFPPEYRELMYEMLHEPTTERPGLSSGRSSTSSARRGRSST